MVINSVVDGGVAGWFALFVASAGPEPAELPASAVGDAAELLHVEVYQVARGVVLVAVSIGPGGLDPRFGGRIGPLQPRAAVAEQHLVDRRGVQSEEVRDPCWPPAAGHSDVDDVSLGTPRELVGAHAWARGPVDHACLAELRVPLDPATNRGDADREPFGRSGLSPSTSQTTSPDPCSRPAVSGHAYTLV